MTSIPKSGQAVAWRNRIFSLIPTFFLGSCAFLCFLRFFFVPSIACAQEPPSAVAPSQTAAPATPPASDKNSPEMASREEATTFKVNVKLVVARVVVRDSKGNAIGNLQKDDFQLFDNRKPQVISQFSVERPGTRVAMEQKNLDANTGEKSPETGSLPSVPERYIAFVFDDVHLQFGDLAHAREALLHHLATLQPTDRAAIFTTSGQTEIDFTDDRAKLTQTLQRIQPHPILGRSMNPCPDVSYYMADLIENQNDLEALQAATQDAMICMSLPTATPTQIQQALQVGQQTADAAARLELTIGEEENRITLSVLKEVVRRISSMPGQRSLVFVSPGFLSRLVLYEYSDIIEHALHSQVVIGSLDARGLYAIAPDLSRQDQHDLTGSLTLKYETQAASDNSDVLAALAEGTGGAFFQNSNDLEEGFRRVAATPEYFYILGFSPQNMKLDGAFHSLKVTLKNPAKLAVQARRGYFAPKHAANPEEEAKQEIEDALYSQEEMHGIPVELHTQFFKSSEIEAKLTVLAHVDVKRLHFRKADGRNLNDLTVVSALFDRNGNFVKGTQKLLTMRWKDETLENKLGSGITMKTSFDVKPGSYLVRLVVRDAEGQQMSAENGAVEIP